MWRRFRPNLTLVPIVACAQGVADLFHRRAGLVHPLGIDRLAYADRAVSAMCVAEAVEQVVMAMEPIAAAVAMQLGEQFGMIAGGAIGLMRGAGVKGRVEGRRAGVTG